MLQVATFLKLHLSFFLLNISLKLNLGKLSEQAKHHIRLQQKYRALSGAFWTWNEWKKRSGSFNSRDGYRQLVTHEGYDGQSHEAAFSSLAFYKLERNSWRRTWNETSCWFPFEFSEMMSAVLMYCDLFHFSMLCWCFSLCCANHFWTYVFNTYSALFYSFMWIYEAYSYCLPSWMFYM